MKTMMIVNAHSRSGKALFDDARRHLAECGVAIERAVAVTNPRHLHRSVEAAIAEGAECVLVGGGDGSLSGVSDLFANRATVMGILPLGTANSFARTLGIPLDIEGACDVIAAGETRDVDLGQINMHYFANSASIGLPAEIGRSIPPILKKLFGRFGYLFYAGWRLLLFRGFRCTIDTGGKKTSHAVVEVRVANGKYFGGLRGIESAEVDSEELVVHLVNGVGPWALARAWAKMGVGEAPAVGEITEISGHRFRIETHPRQPVSVDGEVLTRTPAEARVVPQALRLIAPSGDAV